MSGAVAGRPHGHPGWKVSGVSDDGSELTLRRAASKTTAFELGGGQAAAVAPFRARHANTRHSPVPAKYRRRASRAKPCPTPQPRPGGSTGGRRATRQCQAAPTGRARATPGSRAPIFGGDQTLPHQAGAVGSGRAGCARRGGHRGGCAVPRRVFACPALNGATAAAWPLRSLAGDKLWRSTSPTGQPLRSKARFRTVPQSQLRAVSRPS